MTAHVKSARSKLRCEFGFRSYAKQEQPAFLDQTHQHLFIHSAIYTCLLLFNNKRKKFPKTPWSIIIHRPSSAPVRTMVEFARIHLSMRSWLLVVYQDANIPRPVRCALGRVFVEANGRMNGDFFRLRFGNSGCFEMDNFLICPFLQHEIFTMMA